MKSPLKDNPLRNPGQSLDKEIFDFFYDEMLMYFVIAITAVAMALAEWFRWYFHRPPSPFIYSIIAILAIAL